MRPIDEDPDEPRQWIDSNGLQSLARFLNNRIQVECGRCRGTRKLTLRAGEMRLGKDPDLFPINPAEANRPRIIFYCVFCNRPIGFIQGDDWSESEAEAGDEATRWNHLEIDEEQQAELREKDHEY